MPNLLTYTRPRRRLPREPMTGIFPIYRPVAKRRIDLEWLALVLPRTARNVRHTVPDTARFVLPQRVPRVRRTPPGWERPIRPAQSWSRRLSGLVVHVGDPDPETPPTTDSIVGPPYLGGFLVTDCAWLSATAISVSFTTTYGTDYQYQLYAGRQLIGATVATSERTLVGQLQPSTYPQCLTILAVEPTERLTDYGDRLPPRPYNRVKLRWATLGMPSDMKWIEITSGTVAGGAVSLSNVLALVPFDQNRFYEYLTPPVSGTGTWNFEVAHRDMRPPDGNRGTASAISAAVIAIPPDVESDGFGNRLAVAIASQNATVTYTLP